MDFDYFCEREITESYMLSIGFAGQILGSLLTFIIRPKVERLYDFFAYVYTGLGLILFLLTYFK